MVSFSTFRRCAIALLARHLEKTKGAHQCAIGFLLGAPVIMAQTGCAIDAPLEMSNGANLMTASFWCVLDIAARGI